MLKNFYFSFVIFFLFAVFSGGVLAQDFGFGFGDDDDDSAVTAGGVAGRKS